MNQTGIFMNNWKNEFYLARGLILNRHNNGLLFFDALEQVLNQETLNNLVSSVCSILHTEFQARIHVCIEKVEHMCTRHKNPRFPALGPFAV